MRKNFCSVIISVSVLLGLGSSLLAQPAINYPKKNINGKEYYEYPVQKSEGFFSITRKFDVSKEEILKANPGASNGPTFGSVLLIPVKDRNYKIHKVASKETLFSIKQKYNTSYEELYALNPTLKEKGLICGTEIKIPEAAPAKSQNVNVSALIANSKIDTAALEKKQTPSFVSHMVKKGETLYSISKQYGVSSEEIVRLNPDAKEGVKEGSVLIIPPVHNNTTHDDSKFKGARSEMKSHVVKKGETLYGISKLYGISQDELQRRNPQMKDGLNEGMLIFIPPVYQATAFKEVVKVDYITHEVKRRETLFSIGQKYGVSVEDIVEHNPGTENGIKKGLVLNIPQKVVSQVVDTAAIDSSLIVDTLAVPEKVKMTDPKSEINVALFFPFNFAKVTPTSKTDANTEKFVEFYQGMLVAIDSLKRTNLSVNLRVYDSGKTDADVRKLLNGEELKSMDVLIGPAYTSQIKALSEFAKANNVKLVVPFSSRSEETKVNPNIFQINTPRKESAAVIAEKFSKTFKDKNIVLIRFGKPEYNDEKILGDTLDSILTKNNIKFKSVMFSNLAEIKKQLTDKAENVIFPVTNNQVALSQVLPLINMTDDGKKSISLFGFSEWQSYQGISKDMFKVNMYLVSQFYVDYKSKEVRNFLKKFRKFYNSEPANSQPSYGMLGYDAMMFFGTAISKYGHDFEDKVGEVKVNALQSGLRFNKLCEEGGFYNDCVYITQHNDKTGFTIICK